jgi:pyrroline-5-carboxylate reductase
LAEQFLVNAEEGKGMKKIGFIGAGNMAGALMKGLIASRLYRSQEMLASDTIPTQLKKVHTAYKVEGLRENRALVRAVQTVVLAVKPQIIDDVLAEIQPEATKDKLFISIAAGVPLQRLEHGLGGNARVVRVMPNTPALLGKGIAVIVRGTKAKSQDEKLTLALFRGVGDAIAVKDEALLDPVTGLSGSGPAYVYLFAEALIAGGVQEGLPPAVATRLTLQTLEGAVAMLKETGKSPKELREMVTSPGGTTLAGLAQLEERHLTATVVAAVTAATRRSKELGQG